MATKLEKLLEEIDPSRTIDKAEMRINDALAHYRLENNTVDSWEEHKIYLAEMVTVARNAVLNIPGNIGSDLEINYSQAFHYLEREFGTIQAVYDIMRTGAEGGIYKILRTLARLIAEDYSQNEIEARVAAYWSRLSIGEKFAAADEYIALYRDILPQRIKGEALRLRISFCQVLDDHPRMLKRIRDLKHSS